MQEVSSEFASKRVKLEDDVVIEEASPSNSNQQQQQHRRFRIEPSPVRSASKRHLDAPPLRYPAKYIIRNVDSNSAFNVRRLVKRPSAEDSKPEAKEIEQVAAPYVREAPRRYHVPIQVSPPRVQGAMKFWRTPAGKLVKLDPKAPPLGARAAFAGVVNAQPKFIRLANGKLARISTKKIPAPREGSPHGLSDSNNARFSQFVRDTGRLDAPSATVTITSSSEPIDVTSLIGCGTPTSDETPLFDDSEKQTVTKSEPPEEVEEWEQEEMRLPPPKEREVPKEETRKEAPPRAGQPLAGQPHSQPSLATALNSISSNDAAKTSVGDLDTLVEQPLFTHDAWPVNAAKPERASCKVCREIVPAMKKNMLSLEVRLGCLVETVQNLIIYLNPLDRKAAELAITAGSVPLSCGNDARSETRTPQATTSSTTLSNPSSIRTYRIMDPRADDNDRGLTLLLPARRMENRTEANAVGSNAVSTPSGVHRPNVVRFVRQLPTTPATSEASSEPTPVSAPQPARPTTGRIRFVVADRASALKTISCSNASTGSQASPDKPESHDNVEQMRVSPAGDVKPEAGITSE